MTTVGATVLPSPLHPPQPTAAALASRAPGASKDGRDTRAHPKAGGGSDTDQPGAIESRDRRLSGAADDGTDDAVPDAAAAPTRAKEVKVTASDKHVELRAAAPSKFASAASKAEAEGMTAEAKALLLSQAATSVHNPGLLRNEALAMGVTFGAGARDESLANTLAHPEPPEGSLRTGDGGTLRATAKRTGARRESPDNGARYPAYDEGGHRSDLTREQRRELNKDRARRAQPLIWVPDDDDASSAASDPLAALAAAESAKPPPSKKQKAKTELAAAFWSSPAGEVPPPYHKPPSPLSRRLAEGELVKAKIPAKPKNQPKVRTQSEIVHRRRKADADRFKKAIRKLEHPGIPFDDSESIHEVDPQWRTAARRTPQVGDAGYVESPRYRTRSELVAARRQAAADAFATFDLNNDGIIDAHEVFMGGLLDANNDGILDAEELARASELLDPATLNKFVFGLDASHPKDVPRIVQTLTDNQIFADYGEADRGPDRTGQRPVEATGKIIAAAATISKDIDTNGTYTHQIGQLRAHQTGRPYALEPSLPPADPRVVAAQRAALSGTPPPSAGCSTLVRTDDATEQQLKRARHAAEAAYQAATAAMVAAREERPADEVARLVAAADAATAAAVDATVADGSDTMAKAAADALTKALRQDAVKVARHRAEAEAAAAAAAAKAKAEEDERKRAADALAADRAVPERRVKKRVADSPIEMRPETNDAQLRSSPMAVSSGSPALAGGRIYSYGSKGGVSPRRAAATQPAPSSSGHATHPTRPGNGASTPATPQRPYEAPSVRVNRRRSGRKLRATLARTSVDASLDVTLVGPARPPAPDEAAAQVDRSSPRRRLDAAYGRGGAVSTAVEELRSGVPHPLGQAPPPFLQAARRTRAGVGDEIRRRAKRLGASEARPAAAVDPPAGSRQRAVSVMQKLGVRASNHVRRGGGLRQPFA